MGDTRAVTELVGYVLIFSVVISSIAVLYVSGVGTLTDLREHEQLENADRAFVAIAENFEDLQRGRAPSRSGEIRLAGGELSIDESTGLGVTVSNGGGTNVVDGTVGRSALVYRFEDEAIWYENGAVFRSSEFTTRMSSDPAFLCTPDQAIVSAVTLQRDGNLSAILQTDSAQVVGERTSTELLYPTADADPSVSTVTLNVSASPNSEAWGEYLRTNGWNGTGPYTCETERAYVREVTISIGIRA